MTAGDVPGPAADGRPGPGSLGEALRRALFAYRRRVDEELAAAGFPGRRFPESRVLAMCAGRGETISDIGRGLEITRQGASKVVGLLREHGFVEVTPSAADGREKLVTLTARAAELLARRQAAHEHQEARLREQVGAEAVDQLVRILDQIADDDDFPPEDRPGLRRLRWRDAEGEL